MQKLKDELRPTVRSFELVGHSPAINSALAELEERAIFVPSQCMGYFPGFQGDGIVDDLPRCKEFAEGLPSLIIQDGYEAKFSWLRLALSRQESMSPYHLDGDASTGFGELDEEVTAVRVLLNLSDHIPRKIGFLAIDPKDAPLKQAPGYRQYDGTPPPHAKRTLIIPAKLGDTVFGAIIQVNKVLHAGIDENDGHYLASYSFEVRT